MTLDIEKLRSLLEKARLGKLRTAIIDHDGEFADVVMHEGRGKENVAIFMRLEDGEGTAAPLFVAAVNHFGPLLEVAEAARELVRNLQETGERSESGRAWDDACRSADPLRAALSKLALAEKAP